MSSYRDDTQETMVIADSVFTKVKTDVVENLKIIDKAQFEKVSEELLNVRIKQLTDFKEKQAAAQNES